MVSREGKRVDEMETVPTAIASASIVSAGALGLVFGQVDRTKTSRTSAEDRRLVGYDPEVTNSSPFSRPATSAADRNAYPNDSDPLPIISPDLPIRGTRKSMSRRNTTTSFTSHIFTKRRKAPDDPTYEEEPTEDRKESGSSRGSWLKRLSTVPDSHISSPRSSIGPESPSITFSHGSAAPILNSGPVQLPPNKLVKRAAPGQSYNGSPRSHKGPSHSSSLRRRPATSHQRSATLQQQFRMDEGSASRVQSSSLGRTSLQQAIPLDFWQSQAHLHWTHHFVPRIRRQSRDRSPRDRSPRDRSRIDGNLQSFYTVTRSILPESITPPTLITAKMITQNHAANIGAADHSHMDVKSEERALSSKENSPEQLDTTQIKPRRSLSKHFSPPPAWALRAGSIGRRKRQSMESSDRDRNIPVRDTTSPHIPQHRSITRQHGQPNLSRDNGDIRLAPTTLSRPERRRNCSSPLPPLTRISTFTLDLAQIESSSLPSNAPTRNPAMHEGNIVPMQNPVTSQSTGQSVEFASSPPVSATTHSRLHRAPEVAPFDRASTLVGSDSETRGFYSGEDEDIDFQSDTIFDSFRTGTTGSVKIQHPLETMFDALPSNSIDNNKIATLCDGTSRGSFHEGPNSISEEEGHVAHSENNGQPSEADFVLPEGLNVPLSQAYPSSPPALPMVNEDFGRLSLEDDDDDEDWAREAEEFCVRNSLSPPSSSLHSRGVNPAFRAVLADLTNDDSSAKRSPARPYSSVFEWSESEQRQHLDLSERPKTEHGMRGTDSAGVRRRAPTSLLLRTHSVPVVPDDVVGHSKGSKTTEDWGDDFFEQSDSGPDSGIAILIPPAIQASQANVLGHVGLIRDVLPIVNELKRLCSLGREKNLLDGPHASLWKEAEGIIALASPDDADQAASPVSPTTADFDHDAVDDRYRDCGFDGEDLDRAGEVLDNNFTTSEIVPDATAGRRQSVFLPGDDIFGHSTETTVDSSNLGNFPDRTANAKISKPATFPRVLGKDPAAVARSVMETMHQYRSISDPLHSDLAMKSPNRMPFDTTSLRDFVNRANSLIKTLSEIIRASDYASQSSTCSPKRTENPAFTKVFNDPIAGTPRRLPRTKSSTSNVDGSTDSSPTKNHGKRIHVMTVV